VPPRVLRQPLHGQRRGEAQVARSHLGEFQPEAHAGLAGCAFAQRDIEHGRSALLGIRRLQVGRAQQGAEACKRHRCRICL
jgi:hypothetical protein